MNSSLMGGEQLKVIFQQILDSFESIDSHELLTQLYKYNCIWYFNQLFGCGGSFIEKGLNLDLKLDRGR